MSQCQHFSVGWGTAQKNGPRTPAAAVEAAQCHARTRYTEATAGHGRRTVSRHPALGVTSVWVNKPASPPPTYNLPWREKCEEATGQKAAQNHTVCRKKRGWWACQIVRYGKKKLLKYPVLSPSRKKIKGVILYLVRLHTKPRLTTLTYNPCHSRGG